MAAGAGQEKNWSSRFGFLMAAVGFAVGLGNIWRFPYVTGENGGAAFVLVYLACVLCIGVPILMAELLIGRRGKMSPPNAMKNVAKEEGRSKLWSGVGGMNMLAAFVIEIVYCVISGWVLFYLYKAITTGFAGFDAVTTTAEFDGMLASSGTMLFWTLLGLLITGVIIYAGVKNGIERAVKVLIPSLFGLMVVLVIYNVYAGGFGEAINWLFTPDFSKIDGSVFLAALGQAFFSIGVAMAGVMTYGAYLPKKVSITQSVFIIVFADTLVALLAGMVIFPAVFANGLDIAGGSGLIFQTLPVAFAQMPGGHFAAVLFFLALSVAAITSMVGLIEPITAWLEEHKGFARHKSAIATLSVIALLSVTSILSYNVWSDFSVFSKNLNDAFDYFSNQILLPLGGFLIALFAGWFISKQSSQDELNLKGKGYSLWHFMIRFPVPIAVATILIMGVTE